MQALRRPEASSDDLEDLRSRKSSIRAPLDGALKRCFLTKGCVLLHMIFNVIVVVVCALLTAYDAYHLFLSTDSPDYTWAFVGADLAFIVTLTVEALLRLLVENEGRCGEYVSSCENKFDLIVVVVAISMFLLDYLPAAQQLLLTEAQMVVLRSCRIGLQALLLLFFLKQLFNSALDYRHVSEGYLAIDLKFDGEEATSESDSAWWSDRRRTLLRQTPSRHAPIANDRKGPLPGRYDTFGYEEDLLLYDQSDVSTQASP